MSAPGTVAGTVEALRDVSVTGRLLHGEGCSGADGGWPPVGLRSNAILKLLLGNTLGTHQESDNSDHPANVDRHTPILFAIIRPLVTIRLPDRPQALLVQPKAPTDPGHRLPSKGEAE